MTPNSAVYTSTAATAAAAAVCCRCSRCDVTALIELRARCLGCTRNLAAANKDTSAAAAAAAACSVTAVELLEDARVHAACARRSTRWLIGVILIAKILMCTTQRDRMAKLSDTRAVSLSPSGFRT